MTQWDFEPENKELKPILKALEQWITKNFGKPCKRKATGCSTCITWLIFEALKVQLP